jgi:hypothetical protein
MGITVYAADGHLYESETAQSEKSIVYTESLFTTRADVAATQLYDEYDTGPGREYL